MNSMPGILDRLVAAWRIFRYGERKNSIPFLWPSFRADTPQWHLLDFAGYVREGYSLNSLIYSAIMYKARAASAAPLRAYTGNIKNPELLDYDHPLQSLMRRPNPTQSYREYIMTAMIYLNLDGNCYTYIQRSNPNSDWPDALYLLRPDRVYIVPGSRRGEIRGYIYVPEGASVQDGMPILPQDMSHVKFPNPGDPLDGFGYGLSPIAPLAQSGDVDNQVTKFLKVFFDHGAIALGTLNFDRSLTDSEVARARARWEEIHGSPENWGNVAVLDNGGSYQRISADFEEMGFEQLDERNEVRILGPFGVPLTLMPTRSGMSAATYNNKEQDRRMFWEDTLLPEIGLFEDDMNYYLARDDVFLAADLSNVPALKKDVESMIKSWAMLVEHGVPADVATAFLGINLPELPYGQSALLDSRLIIQDGETLSSSSNNTPSGEPDSNEKQKLEAVEMIRRAGEYYQKVMLAESVNPGNGQHEL
jgi:HK97 family phage portal protein